MEGDERGRSHTTRQPTDDGATRDDDIAQRRRWRSRRGGTGSGPSAWNALGTTWEEKDATDWCTKTLERCLLDAPASSYFSELSSTACVASVKGVLDVKGDASVAIAGGKKWYIYDYHATVEYEISDRGGRSRVRIVEAARGAQREYVLREEEEELDLSLVEEELLLVQCKKACDVQQFKTRKLMRLVCN